MSSRSSSPSHDSYEIKVVKKQPSSAKINQDEFPALQGKAFEPEFQKVGKKIAGKKIYVFMISYDKQKGSQEKPTVNLLANSLKDYVNYTFAEIKSMADSSKLIKEDFTETSSYVQWRFIWNVKPEFYKELLDLEEILMRTAEIYFKVEPYLERKTQGNGFSPVKPQHQNQNQMSSSQDSISQSDSSEEENININNNNSSNKNVKQKQQFQQQQYFSNSNKKPQQQQQQQQQHKLFGSAEEEKRYHLKVKYRDAMKLNEELKKGNQILREQLKGQENDLQVKTTELQQFVDVLQVTLQQAQFA